MQTKDCSAEEIQDHVARFKDLTPNSTDFLDREGIPVGAYEMIAAKKIFPVAASKRDAEMSNTPAPIDIPEGLSVFICEVPPGNGPEMHAHMFTRETFMALRGRFKIRFGKGGESIELAEMDTVSVPNGVLRAFENITDETAYLLVLIHEGEHKALNDVYLRPEVGEKIAAAYGQSAVEGLERIGNNFNADADTTVAAE